MNILPLHETLNEQGLSFEEQGNFKDAAERFREAIKLSPREPKYYSNLTSALISLGEWQELEYITRKAIELDATDSNHYYRLGISLKNQSKFNEAINAFESAIGVKPTSINSWAQIDNISQIINNKEKSAISLENIYRLDPENLYLLDRKAQICTEEGRNDEAISICELILTRDPKDPTAWARLGQNWQILGNDEKAIIPYQNAITLDPNYLPVLENLAIIFHNNDRTQEAFELYTTIVSKNPENPKAWARIGQYYHGISNVEKAIISYQNSLKYDKNYMFVLELLANILHENNRNEEAFNVLDQLDKAAISQNKKPNPAYESWSDFNKSNWAHSKSMIGHRYFKIDETEKAVEFFREAANITPLEFQFRIDLGRALNELGEWAESIIIWEGLISTHPSLLLAYIYLSRAYAKKRRFDEAKTCLGLAGALPLDESYTNNYISWSNVFGTSVSAFDDLTNFLMISKSMFHFEFGNWFNAQGLFEEAINQFQKCIEINVDDGDSYLNLGNSYRMLGRFDEAEEAYNQSIRCCPDDGEIYSYLGILYLNEQKISEAITVLKKSVRLSPNDPVAWHNLGYAHLIKKEYNETIETILNSLAINPQNAAARKLIGTAYYYTGDINRAEIEIRILEKLDPEKARELMILGNLIRSR